jgi:hypothetical protein
MQLIGFAALPELNSSPRWVVSDIAGEKIFYSDRDKESNSTARTYLRFAHPN